MGRWEPDARGRLEKAAMELYSERGFEATTVAEIASKAGLTERTFFRHFADKREVLFWGAGALEEFLVSQVDGAPDGVPPIDVIVAAFDQAANVIFEERRGFAGRRQAIIAENVELQERELVKLSKLASALGEALRRRGVAEPASILAAEAGIAIFKVAFERWVRDTGSQRLAMLVQEAADDLRELTVARRRVVAKH